MQTSEKSRTITPLASLTGVAATSLATATATATAIAIDQISKEAALTGLSNDVISIFPAMSLRLVFNPGMSFGMDAEIGPLIGFVVTAIVIVLPGLAVVLAG